MLDSLYIDIQSCQYQVMVGVGGIGTGDFFALDGNHTLGREESRSGHFLDRRDYCKLHIISHYVKTLLGDDFKVIPIGNVGGDRAGQRLLDEMFAIGIDLRYVESSPGEQTLYSFCFLYPDGSGGNMTVGDSACNKVTPKHIARVESELACFRSRGIVLAVPEVPLPARRRLLQLGTKYQFFRVAAFISAEMKAVITSGLLGLVDLIAINLDEAATVSGVEIDLGSPFPIVEAAVQKLLKINPELLISVTAGKMGSWIWDGNILNHFPGFTVPVINTAGAGDAFLAGLIVGLVVSLTFSQAQELGTLVAALSVTSPHTINPEIGRQAILKFSSQSGLSLSKQVNDLFQDISSPNR
jgi:sugar/nucleoside kinase (ribokinase family)